MKPDIDNPPPALRGEQAISLDVLAEKYLKSGETTVDDVYRRVARALASVEAEGERADYEALFLANLRAGAIGAGRIMSAAGTSIQATLINCFVQPVGDCIQGVDDDGYPGIYEALREAAETMRRGGGVGYDFSRIRPRGAEVKGTASMASGPCSYINVFDHSCATVESAGARRGAQMGVLRIDHPDVLEFITAKRTPGRWNNFNVSLGVPDSFMHALAQNLPWELVHRAKPGLTLEARGAWQRADGLWVYQTLAARALWDIVMRSAYDFAEPGMLFLDQINQDNNLRYIEKIEATNPCVTADTWVQTSAGPRQVSQLIGRKFDAVVDGVAYPAVSEGFFQTGTKDVFKLKLENGFQVRLTGDHQVLAATAMTRYTTTRAWVRAQDLKAGDMVVLNNHRACAGWLGRGSEEEGFCLGFMLGDGYLGSFDSLARLTVWTADRSVGNGAPIVDEGARSLMNYAERCVKTMNHRADFKGFSQVSDQNHFSLKSKALFNLAASYGMTPSNKVITDQVEEASRAFYAGFLRGLFDADGSVQGSQEKGVSVRLSQSNLDTLNRVQRMLARLGIVSAIYRFRRHAGERMMPDGKGGEKLYPCKASHELVISGDNLAQFFFKIGFADSRKMNDLESRIGQYKRAMNLERFVGVVESLAADGVEDVYDVKIDEVHAFDANGIYIHNCGEQPLPPYGCCDLGPIILPRFVRHPFDVGGVAAFDFEGFANVVMTQVRALDNVLDLTFWPLPQQRAEAAAKRRIGVGFTGMGNVLTMLCLRYDEPAGRDMAVRIASCMRDAAYTASIALARERGSFPRFDVEGYLEEGTFASRLPVALQEAIRTYGIRNSHLLSIAPTGTVSLAFADNASNGIEPSFSWVYRRKKREADGQTTEYAVEDHAWRLYQALGGDVANLPDYFVSALQMSAQSHIAMMQAVQPLVDTAISKTVNVPADCPYEVFSGLYQQAWHAGLKGLATYRPNAILGSVLDAGPAPVAAQVPPAALPESSPAAADPMRTVIERRPKGALPAVAEKIEYWTQEGHKTLYLVVSFLPMPTSDGGHFVQRAIEFFMPLGQSGESQQWITSSMRMLSLAARGGFLERALRDMRKVAWDRGPVRLGTHEKADGSRVPLWHDSEVAAIAYALQQIIAQRSQADVLEPLAAAQAGRVCDELASPPAMVGKKCAECGAYAVIRKDGCDYCTQCGHVGSCG
jgi:ribonucleoside-diphosphate reductase alpha chain